VTPAVIFRVLDIAPLTFTIDEADTFIKDKEELRGLLNSGHTRSGAYVIRAISPDGNNWVPKKFSTWGAFAYAAIGRLPDTWVDRSISIRLKRKLRSEKVRRYRKTDTKLINVLSVLTRKITRWAADNQDLIIERSATIEAPNEISSDRAVDNWQPLFAIANLAGGKWPTLARDAAIVLSGEPDEDSLRTMLLADLRTIFDEPTNVGMKVFASLDLCRWLVGMEGRPWAEPWRGTPLTQNRLATLLKGFKICSTTVWPNGREKPSARGYKRADFQDSFKRYLPPITTPPISTDTVTQANAPKGESAVTLKTTKRPTASFNRKVAKFSKEYKRPSR